MRDNRLLAGGKSRERDVDREEGIPRDAAPKMCSRRKNIATSEKSSQRSCVAVAQGVLIAGPSCYDGLLRSDPRHAAIQGEDKDDCHQARGRPKIRR